MKSDTKQICLKPALVLLSVLCCFAAGAEKLPQEYTEIRLLLAVLKAEDSKPVAGARVEYWWAGKWHEFHTAEANKKAVSKGKLSMHRCGKRECKANVAATGRVHAYSLQGKRMIPPCSFRVIKDGYEPEYFVPLFRKQDSIPTCSTNILLRPKRNVTLSLKITDAADTKPVSGARVQYRDPYARHPKYVPPPGNPGYRWRDIESSNESPALSRGTMSNAEGKSANFRARGHIPDSRAVDRKGKYKRAVLRIVKKGYESAYFFIDQESLWKSPTYHAEFTLRPLGLVSHWQFDKGGGGTAYETTGLGNAGTISGAEWTKDSGRTALKFDGTDDVVHCGRNPAYEQLEAITLLMWIKPPENVTRMESLIGRAWRNPYALYTRKGNGLEISIALGNYKGQGYRGYLGGMHYVTKPALLKPGEWNLVGFGYDRATGNITMFYNGKVVQQRGVRQGEGRFICVPSGQPLSIGYFDGIPHFTGLIDDVRMYNYSLSEEEVKKIYEGSK